MDHRLKYSREKVYDWKGVGGYIYLGVNRV